MVFASFLGAWALAAPVDGRPAPLLQGTWTVLQYDQNGHKAPAEIVRKMKVIIRGDKIRIEPRVAAQYRSVLKNGKRAVEVVFTAAEDEHDEIHYKLEAAKERINLFWKGGRGKVRTTKGVYVLEGQTLKICFSLLKKKKPKKIPDQPKPGLVRLVLQSATE
jgi:uncharacterized protein (TIGR03067 family)